MTFSRRLTPIRYLLIYSISLISVTNKALTCKSSFMQDGLISYDEFVAMMKTGTDWRKASRHYSRGRFNSLSIKLMKDGSINLGE